MKLAEYPIEFDANQHLENLIGEYRDLALRQTSSTGSDTARWQSESGATKYIALPEFTALEECLVQTLPVREHAEPSKTWHINRMVQVSEDGEFSVKIFQIGFHERKLCMRIFTSERLKRNTPPEWYQTAKKTMKLQQRLGLNIPILHDYATPEDSVRDLRLHEGTR